MPSPERRAAAALVLAAVCFALLGIAAAVSRSLIPHRVDATIDRIEVRHEKHPGVDDVWLVHLDGRAVHVDAATARRLQVGVPLHKERWDTRLTAGDRAIPLSLSHDAQGMLWVMPLTVLAAIAVARVGAGNA